MMTRRELFKTLAGAAVAASVVPELVSEHWTSFTDGSIVPNLQVGDVFTAEGLAGPFVVTSEALVDKEIGISIRFIREWDVKTHTVLCEYR